MRENQMVRSAGPRHLGHVISRVNIGKIILMPINFKEIAEVPHELRTAGLHYEYEGWIKYISNENKNSLRKIKPQIHKSGLHSLLLRSEVHISRYESILK